jgi:hypothetical protein
MIKTVTGSELLIICDGCGCRHKFTLNDIDNYMNNDKLPKGFVKSSVKCNRSDILTFSRVYYHCENCYNVWDILE